ncbi:MAG: sialate O-acetylesterase [Phycisphaeraceae bacterium]
MFSLKIPLTCLLSLLIVGQASAAADTVITYADPTPGTVPEGTPIKVFLAGGQSNMRGRATVLDKSNGNAQNLPVDMRGEQTDVLMVRGSQNRVGDTLDYLQPGYSEEDPGSFGPEVPFGRTIADLFPEENFAILKYARGGTNLRSNWNPDNPNENDYDKFIQTVNNGLQLLTDAGYDVQIVGMIWHQGESDAFDQTAENLTYQPDLVDFIADIRSNYGEDLPFMIGGINDVRDGTDFIIQQQQAVATSDDFATFVRGDDLTFADDFHFDAPGMITLGERFANQYAADYGSLIPEPSSLMLLGVGGLALVRRRRDWAGR